MSQIHETVASIDGKTDCSRNARKRCLVSTCFWSICFHFRVRVSDTLSDCLTFDRRQSFLQLLKTLQRLGDGLLLTAVI